jgi:hypothetical protein
LCATATIACSGTIQYPSVGSIVSHELGAKSEEVPSYVVMGYPNITRDPGFLGAGYAYVYLTQVDIGPNGLVRPPDVGPSRQHRRETLLASLRDAYGSEFGQRCLLARRLVQSGVRFIEVSFNLNFLNGTGWDTHNEGQLNQHLLIQDLDRSFSTLLLDLEKNRILDKTLVVIGTEFGRPPEFDSGGGRGHQSEAFTMVLAGGGDRRHRRDWKEDRRASPHRCRLSRHHPLRPGHRSVEEPLRRRPARAHNGPRQTGNRVVCLDPAYKMPLQDISNPLLSRPEMITSGVTQLDHGGSRVSLGAGQRVAFTIISPVNFIFRQTRTGRGTRGSDPISRFHIVKQNVRIPKSSALPTALGRSQRIPVWRMTILWTTLRSR